MAEELSAKELLESDAKRIQQLITNQKNQQCIAYCKAFEEVVDTQMYGFSRQVEFAVRLGLVEKKEGQALLADLERQLNQLYSEVYEKTPDDQEDKL